MPEGVVTWAGAIRWGSRSVGGRRCPPGCSSGRLRRHAGRRERRYGGDPEGHGRHGRCRRRHRAAWPGDSFLSRTLLVPPTVPLRGAGRCYGAHHRGRKGRPRTFRPRPCRARPAIISRGCTALRRWCGPRPLRLGAFDRSRRAGHDLCVLAVAISFAATRRFATWR